MALYSLPLIFIRLDGGYDSGFKQQFVRLSNKIKRFISMFDFIRLPKSIEFDWNFVRLDMAGI